MRLRRKVLMFGGRTRRTVVFIVALAVGVAARAEDWPQWRGAKRDGAWGETGLLKAFPAEGLKIRWRRAVGWGWSSPVIAGGRVFVTDSELMRPAAKERVHSFDEATGKPLWTYSHEVTYPDWAFEGSHGSGPTATPIVDAGKVYTLGANGHVHCLNALSGEVVWETNLGKQYQIREMICRASPLIEGDLLIVFTGGKPGACLVALDKNSGKEVWKALDESVSNSSPMVVEAGGRRQLIVWTCESVTSLDPRAGKMYWRERMVTSSNDAISSPVSHGDWLLIGGLMLELKADKPAASVLWPATRAVSRRVLSNTSTALLRGDHVFSAKSSGELVCLEARTGKQVWETDKVTDLKGGASIHLTPAGDVVFLYNEKGELILAELSAKGYQEISRSRLLEPTYPFGGRKCAWAPPAYANGHVFARSDTELVSASLAAKP